MAAINAPGPEQTCGPLPAFSKLQLQRNSNTGPANSRSSGQVAPLPPPASPLRPHPNALKALTKQDLAAYAQQKKLERQQRREEEAARLRASKLAALTDSGTLPHAQPAVRVATSRGVAHPEVAATAGSVRGSSKATLPSRHSSSGSASHNGPTIRHGKEQPSCVSSAVVPVPLAAHPHGNPVAAAGLPPTKPAAQNRETGAPGQASRSSKWSPRKQPQAGRPGQVSSSALEVPRPSPVLSATGTGWAAAVGLQGPCSGTPGRPVRQLLPGLSATATAAAAVHASQQTLAAQPARAVAAAVVCDEEAVCGREAGEVEARRMQQLVDWGALLVQAAATEAAERVLLGPAARQHSQGSTAAFFQRPSSPGQHPPHGLSAPPAAVLSGVTQAVAALATQRQLKQQLAGLAADGGGASWQQVLGCEAAADLQAQGLLAHWGLHAACEAQRTVHVRGVHI
ncbi:hypothetical protein D9Q98_010230 [Chlorella vulgaris]|uniref:Uncharacterized protein n=1 Tax=Chlorella vulgaris TaxID=3077 RepID=A0A9D4TJP8_CHLVU|nr:hypothetical protein D9Q98_010230 [Chlorella vulgaris]